MPHSLEVAVRVRLRPAMGLTAAPMPHSLEVTGRQRPVMGLTAVQLELSVIARTYRRMRFLMYHLAAFLTKLAPLVP